MRPATLLLTIFLAVAAAANEMPGMDMGKGAGDIGPTNSTTSPKNGGTTTTPSNDNNGGGGGKQDGGSGNGKHDDDKSDGGKPAKGGAGSLAPTLLMALGAAGLAALVA